MNPTEGYWIRKLSRLEALPSFTIPLVIVTVIGKNIRPLIKKNIDVRRNWPKRNPSHLKNTYQMKNRMKFPTGGELFSLTYPWGLTYNLLVQIRNGEVVFTLQKIGRIGIISYDDLKPHPDEFCKDCAETFIRLHPESKPLIEAGKIRKISA